MRLRTKQRVASWVLLAVYLPMLLLASLHVHDVAEAAVEQECADCVHHSCHGHLTASDFSVHECVLCQFLSLTFTAACAAAVVFFLRIFSVRYAWTSCAVCMPDFGVPGLRAPPVCVK